MTHPPETGFFHASPWVAELHGSANTDRSAGMLWSEHIIEWFFYFADIPLQPEDLQVILPVLDAPDDTTVEARRERLSAG